MRENETDFLSGNTISSTRPRPADQIHKMFFSFIQHIHVDVLTSCKMIIHYIFIGRLINLISNQMGGGHYVPSLFNPKNQGILLVVLEQDS